MNVGELRSLLDMFDDNADVCICVNEPSGYFCPGGAVVNLKKCCRGIDWHEGMAVLVPEHRLNIANVIKWVNGDKHDN